jgi:hypothetical protein
MIGLSGVYGVEDGSVIFTLTSFTEPLRSDRKKIASIIMIEITVSPVIRIRASLRKLIPAFLGSLSSGVMGFSEGMLVIYLCSARTLESIGIVLVTSLYQS